MPNFPGETPALGYQGRPCSSAAARWKEIIKIMMLLKKKKKGFAARGPNIILSLTRDQREKRAFFLPFIFREQSSRYPPPSSSHGDTSLSGEVNPWR